MEQQIQINCGLEKRDQDQKTSQHDGTVAISEVDLTVISIASKMISGKLFKL
jgi:hypothetical protein